ncbi:conserved hypothetical protein [Ricinus communis]|uniref:Uncharacterized protein n=1 Tax=Ricinus communis TaxID=3988 RepID=B9THB2_RICCO|nr:conserved hypothetical protein [Ricinus communis]
MDRVCSVPVVWVTTEEKAIVPTENSGPPLLRLLARTFFHPMDRGVYRRQGWQHILRIWQKHFFGPYRSCRHPEGIRPRATDQDYGYRHQPIGHCHTGKGAFLQFDQSTEPRSSFQRKMVV